MNMALYSDSEKNLVMFLPEEIPDEQIVSIGETVRPSRFAIENSEFEKPLGSLNYKEKHATYPIFNTFTDLNYFVFSEIEEILAELKQR